MNVIHTVWNFPLCHNITFMDRENARMAQVLDHRVMYARLKNDTPANIITIVVPLPMLLLIQTIVQDPFPCYAFLFSWTHFLAPMICLLELHLLNGLQKLSTVQLDGSRAIPSAHSFMAL
jgi:hypothetical protein